MFGDLSKLLDRDFAVGFVLPAAIFFAASDALWRLQDKSLAARLGVDAEANPWLGVTLVVLVVWLAALFLLSTNRVLVRLKEGYGWNVRWNPLTWYQGWRLARLEKQIARLDAERLHAKSARKEAGLSVPRADRFSEAKKSKLKAKLVRRVRRYPDQRLFLLPTAFGNTIRAFEVYSRVMYGAEATELWDRLLTVVPKDYRELVDSARSQVDFWVNVWAVSVALLIECIVLERGMATEVPPWVYGVLVGALVLASDLSRRTGELWGNRVRACFDVYLPELGKKMQLPRAETRQEERGLWEKTSSAMVYAKATSLPELRPSDAPEPGGQTGAGQSTRPVGTELSGGGRVRFKVTTRRVRFDLGIGSAKEHEPTDP